MAGVAAVAGLSEDAPSRDAAQASGARGTSGRTARPATPTGAPRNGAAGGQLCFGAAARDPLAPCDNPDLRLKVIPTPDEALLEPNARCRPVGRTATLLPCAFGVPVDGAAGQFALLGDSHAAHWRATLEGVAQSRRWSGTSITRSGCPFSEAVARLPRPARGQCLRWNRATMAWLARHPQVSTVFVAQHRGGKVVTAAGATNTRTQIDGYTRAWRAMPATVKQIFVIRDTPRGTSRSADCIARAVARRTPPGPACALPRSSVLRPDPAVAAARQMASPRVRLVDMTRYMCTARACPPVIGGALVHKDADHLTQTFATSLAPYMLRRVDVVLGR